MTSAYPQLMQDMWSNDRGISAIEALMRPHEFNNKNDHNRRTNDSSRQMSEMSYLEEQHERNQLNIRNFGYHWLKPIGVAKTMGQIEDEAREVHESYEEYDDEEGEFNQNNPDMNGGMEGQESLLPEETSEHQEEEEDLDQGIEEGASFDVEETSFVSSAPMTPAQTSSGLYTVVNGAPFLQSADGSLTPLQRSSGEFLSGHSPATSEAERSVRSAEEGSIGDYSSVSAEEESDAD